MILYSNYPYEVYISEQPPQMEGEEPISIYIVKNTVTGVTEHRTIILPDAIQVVDEWSEALKELGYDLDKEVNKVVIH